MLFRSLVENKKQKQLEKLQQIQQLEPPNFITEEEISLLIKTLTTATSRLGWNLMDNLFFLDPEKIKEIKNVFNNIRQNVESDRENILKCRYMYNINNNISDDYEHQIKYNEIAERTDFIKNNNNRYDLIHIDIVHFYKETFECAELSINHSKVVILHDTVSFREVYQVCEDIERKHKVYFNRTINSCHGLGVLYNPRLN